MFLNRRVLEISKDPRALWAFFLTQRTGSREITHWLHQFILKADIYHFRNVPDFVHWRYQDARTLDRFRVYSGFSDYIPRQMERPLAAFSLVRHPLYRLASLYEMSKADPEHRLHALAQSSSFSDYYIEGVKDRAYYFQDLCCQRVGGKPNSAAAFAQMNRSYAIVAATAELSKFTEFLVRHCGISAPVLGTVAPDSEKYAAYWNEPITGTLMRENRGDLELFEAVTREDIVEETRAPPVGAPQLVMPSADKDALARPVIVTVTRSPVVRAAQAPVLEVLKDTRAIAAAGKTLAEDKAATMNTPAAQPVAQDAATRIVPAHPPCPVCGDPLAAIKPGDGCPACNTPPRGRSLDQLLRRVVGPHMAGSGLQHLPLLAFAMTGAEAKFLARSFPRLKSVSLYGSYGTGHETGVDARDLSRYAPDSFSGAFSILLFDYFPEFDAALEQLSRVIAPGGILFTLVLTSRIMPGASAPVVTKQIQPRPGYFDYIPKDGVLLNVKVGQDWFLAALARAGFEAQQVRIWDAASGEALEWFVGIKRAAGVRLPAAPKLEATAPVAVKTEPAKPEPASSAPIRETAPAIAIAGPAVLATKESRVFSKTFDCTVDKAFGFSRLKVELSIPNLPLGAQSASFAEHVPGTGQVVAVQRGAVVVSDDLGKSWKIIRLPEIAAVPLVHCFTTASGAHLLQAQPGKAPDLGADVYTFDRNWRLTHKFSGPQAPWHATYAVSEANGTIMWAEYPDNVSKYGPEEQAALTAINPRVYRSRDDGATWQKVFERSWRDIRHFHTLVADSTVSGRWWLSSGDRPAESRVWVSNDDGDSWIDATGSGEGIVLAPRYQNLAQSVHRYTAVWMNDDIMIWGTDDWLGTNSAVNDPDIPRAQRVGARVCWSPKTVPLKPRMTAWAGNPVRSITDLGPALLMTTEAKHKELPKPQVFLVSKQDPGLVQQIMELDVLREDGSGFTYSRASRATHEGVMFSFRGAMDLAQLPARILRWQFDF